MRIPIKKEQIFERTDSECIINSEFSSGSAYIYIFFHKSARWKRSILYTSTVHSALGTASIFRFFLILQVDIYLNAGMHLWQFNIFLAFAIDQIPCAHFTIFRRAHQKVIIKYDGCS